MADKKLPPGMDPEIRNEIKSKDLLRETTTNMDSARAKRINSLHRSVEDITQEQNRKRLQVSNEVSALTKQQQKMMAQLELERGEITSDVAQGYSNVLKGLGRTIDSLATGVRNITVDTGKATTQAINQYGKAISEDISINRTNTVAMALSTATPLFGYFAGKFMETDVFKDAAQGIKDKVKNAMTEGVSKAKGTISGIFSKGKEAEEEAMPHLQEGGFIRKGGIVEVHAAEVVTPIDKLLEQIDEAKSADIALKLNNTLNLMSERLSRVETIVVEREQKQQKGLVQTFIEEFQKARDTKEASWQNRLLKAVLELKVAMVGMTSRLRIAWQRTLLQHPAFRNMLMFSDLLQSAIISPVKFLFGARGGYAGDVRRAMSTDNVFLKSANILSLIYTRLMPQIDKITVYTRAMAEQATGSTINVPERKTTTMFGQIREMMTSRSIQSMGESIFDSMIEKLGLDRSAMKEAGISSLSDFLKPGKVFRNMGVTKENLRDKFLGGKSVKENFSDIRDYVFNLMKMKKAQEKREGPHSPSMAQNIASTAEATQQAAENSEEQLGMMDSMRKRLKKWGSKIWEFAIFGLTFLKDMLFKGIGQLTKLLGPALSLIGGAVGGAATKLGLGGIGGAATKAGGALGTAGKFGLGLAGRMVGVTAGALVGGGMGLWDMFNAIREGNATGFVGNWIIRGIAGFMGGRETGWAGAKHGALKGGALGAAAGSVIPGLGTMLGGAIGAAAGGILGFVGGKKISEGISKSLATIGDLAKGLWNIVTFPMKAFREAAKSVLVVAKWGFNKIFGGAIKEFRDWWEKPSFLSGIIDWIKMWVGKIIGAVKGAFSWLWKKLDLKEKLYTLMFPIVAISKVFTKVRDMLDENIEKIPVIGAIYKRVKATVKSIHNRTFSSDLEKWLNDEGAAPWEPDQKSAASNVSSLTPNQRFRREQRMHAEQLRRNAIREAKGGSLGLDRLREANTDVYMSQKEVLEHRRSMNKLENRLDESIRYSGQKTTAAVIQNTNIVAQTNSTLSNMNGGGGGSAGGGFSSGNKFASDVTRCNIN